MSNENKRPSTEHTTELTFVVRLLDAYTGRPIMKHDSTPRAVTRNQRQSQGQRRDVVRYPRTSLKEVDTHDENRSVVRDINTDHVVNNSGFLLFLDVEIPENSDVKIDGGQHYLDEKLPVEPETDSETLASLGLADENEQRRSLMYQEIRLRPSPVYRFPAGTTLLRGAVQDSEGNGVEGVRLTVDGPDQTTETVDDGEFVLYFEPSNWDHIRMENGDRELKTDGADPRIAVERDSFDTQTVSLTVVERKMQSYILRYDRNGNLEPL